MKQASVIMGKTHVLPIPMKPVTSASEIERKIEKQKNDNLASTATIAKSAVFVTKNDDVSTETTVNVNTSNEISPKSH
jgi:hypothetical protein